ncbi:tRNA (adenine-N1)-methyltransferase [uncultured Bifidobacterium sp.]|uniref:tRNA (adenine-N1)-methyltransferase n=1 Tax=uncultured Bifidobacterium sp. TaxID=165187 RepID=UPI00261D72D3|nr:tRNA (adenine-N1)-methyltransferase [uncultured Bifidobacterium sp.]
MSDEESMHIQTSRGPLRPGEKVQLTDRRGRRYTEQLVRGAVTQTDHGFIRHDDIIGIEPGGVVTSVSGSRVRTARESGQSGEADGSPSKPWKGARDIGGWPYMVMRPRAIDYILSMPRGAQIMYPKDIAQVLAVGDIRPGMSVLESGVGSGAMSLALVQAVGPSGSLVSVEVRPDFAKVARANVSLFLGYQPSWWDLRVDDCDSAALSMPEHRIDRVVLDMLDPWNRLDQIWRIMASGGILVAYVTTTSQMSRMAEALRGSDHWTEPEIGETLARGWKADGLAVRPEHEMIGHTGFLIVSRAMSPGVVPPRRHERAAKDTCRDIDSLTPQERRRELEELELRDISDRKLRKVLRDLDRQTSYLASESRRDIDGCDHGNAKPKDEHEGDGDGR